MTVDANGLLKASSCLFSILPRCTHSTERKAEKEDKERPTCYICRGHESRLRSGDLLRSVVSSAGLGPCTKHPMFKAIYLTKSDQFRAELRDLDDAELEANTPEADTTVAIGYSTVNYKDGLALTNKSPVVRKWPMVPGIDCAGTVEAGTSLHVRVGDHVVLNGWGAGETMWGGLAQRGRYKGEQLVRIPAPLTARDAMSIGTAGYTAMLAAMALVDNGVTSGEVLVTGASGGVGSFAVAILAQRGHRVVASTGKLAEVRLSARVRRRRSHRSCRTIRRWQTATKRALGRRHRFGRQSDACQRVRSTAIRRCGGRVRTGAGDGFSRHRRAFHFARRTADRYRFGNVPNRSPHAGMAASGARSEPR